MRYSLPLGAVLGVAATTAIAASAVLGGRLPSGASRWSAAGPLASIHRGELHATNRWFVAGCVALALAWLAVSAGCRARRRAPWVPAVIVAAWCIPLFFAPPIGSGDAYSYTAQGRVLVNGGDPYRIGAGEALAGTPTGDSVDALWRSTPSSYGPLWLGLSGIVARVAGERPEVGILALRLLACGSLALVAIGVTIIARRRRRDPGFVVALVIGSPLLIVHLVGGLHNDGLMLGLTVLAVAAAVAERPAAAVVLATAAAAVKAPALLVLAFLLLRTRLREIPKHLALALLTFAVITGVAGVGIGWIHHVNAAALIDTPLSLTTDVGLVLARRLTPGTPAGHAALLVVTRWLGVLLAGAIILRTALSRRLDLVESIAIGLLALVCLNAVVYPWYLTWPLAFLPVVAGLEARPPAILGLVGVSLLATMGALAGGGSFVYPPTTSNAALLGVAAAVAAAIAVLAGVVLARPRRAGGAVMAAFDSADGPGSESWRPV